MISHYHERYRAYAASNGRTPEQQMAADGSQIPFIHWDHDRTVEYAVSKGGLVMSQMTEQHSMEITQGLLEKYCK